jgi:hypothetical protein
MKENDLKTTLEQKLREKVLMAARAGDDRLMLADAIIGAALDGSRPLTPNERAALAQSPLTIRRLRQLSIERRRKAGAWTGSAGMLRAASGDAALDELVTDDSHWALHFLAHDGRWQVILKLAADAPFAPRLMREQPMLRVLDGGGAIILQGRLGGRRVQTAWPFETGRRLPAVRRALRGRTGDGAADDRHLQARERARGTPGAGMPARDDRCSRLHDPAGRGAVLIDQGGRAAQPTAAAWRGRGQTAYGFHPGPYGPTCCRSRRKSACACLVVDTPDPRVAQQR